MAFQKLIWHFYVVVAFHRRPGSGRALGAPLQHSLRAASPFPKEPAQDSRERGRAWGRPALPSAGGGGRGRSGGPAARGGGRRGRTREPRRRLPGIPPQALREARRAVQPPSPPRAFPRRPVSAPERFQLELTPPCPCGNLTPLALRAPDTPLLLGYLTLTLALSNAPGSCTGGDGSRVPGEKTPGCVGVRMGAGTPSSTAPGNPLFSLVEWGRYQPTNPGRMRPQSGPTSIPNSGGQDTQQSRDRHGLGAEWSQRWLVEGEKE